MKLSELETELIRELRIAPLSELEAFMEVFNRKLGEAMDEIGREAINNWNIICAGNISGIIEEIVDERKSKERTARIRWAKIRFMPRFQGDTFKEEEQ
jgi:undecaprenyl pyrophosphate synthase